MTAYFGYLSDLLHVVHNQSPSAPYHLTRWLKQICRFVGFIWVEYAKVPFDCGCESYVWIVFNKFFGGVLFSSFELHIVWLNHLSTHMLFDWTIPVAVHWLNRFSNCIVIDWTVYLVLYYLLNHSHNCVYWNCH